MIDRVPPQNIEAEQAVLGAMLLEREAIAKVMEKLRSEDFYREAHKVIFNAMLELYNRNEAVDLVTVTEVLKKNGKLEDVGGIAYVTSLANSVPTAANVVYHAGIVEEKSILRQLVRSATEIAELGYEGSEDVSDIIDSAEKKILDISNRKKDTDFVPINNIVMDSFKDLEALMNNKNGLTGLPTGFVDFDNLTSGLHGSDFIILAARPSMGKTALSLNIVQNVAIRSGKQTDGKPKVVAFFSLEMSKEQLVTRMIAMDSLVDSQKVQTGQLAEDDWDQVLASAESIAAAPLYIEDSSALTISELRSKCRQLKSKNNLGLIIIDYLQLMSTTGRVESRQQFVSDMSRSLKMLARELDVPIIALSQLNREVDKRPDHKPVLADLRESGSIEQDADVVMFIYRDDYYNPDTDKKGISEIIIAKQRKGATGSVDLVWLQEYTKFANKEH